MEECLPLPTPRSPLSFTPAADDRWEVLFTLRCKEKPDSETWTCSVLGWAVVMRTHEFDREQGRTRYDTDVEPVVLWEGGLQPAGQVADWSRCHENEYVAWELQPASRPTPPAPSPADAAPAPPSTGG